MTLSLLMKAGNVSEELEILNEHSLNSSLGSICVTLDSLGCGSMSSCC